MHPFLISVAITVSHFFLLNLLWIIVKANAPQYLSLILWAYLLAGSLPYLYTVYSRQQEFNPLVQILTYLLGMGILSITLGFVWQCQIQVVKIRIPMVVGDPPWMTALLGVYIGIGLFLCYLMSLLSDGEGPHGQPSPSPELSEVTNPILKGVIKSDRRSKATRRKPKGRN
jgi:hypothetical protein